MLQLPLFLLAALVTFASGHQNFHQLWVNGVSTGYEKCIRMPPSNNPVTALTSNDIACNVNGNVIPSSVDVCTAKAGDEITVQWDMSSHPGPITHFLYGPVSNAKSATGVGSWFKIAETNINSAGEWANVVMGNNGGKHTFKLPSKLPSGDYLLRSEMEALHSSTVQGQTQFYIGCAQLKITGPGGSCNPKINLPGAYKATDTNIYISNFYYGFNSATFTAPGGPVATCT